MGQKWAMMSVCALVIPFLTIVSSQKCTVGENGPQLYGYEVVAEFPHDSRAFTQGLQFDTVCSDQGSCKDVFWESTGKPEASAAHLQHGPQHHLGRCRTNPRSAVLGS